MSRPGPKPNNDLISEQVDCLERLLRHIVRDKADDTTKQLLRELDELKIRPFLCSICNKSYSDAKGLRRHILTAPVDHETLAGQLSALVCRWCGRSTTDVGRKYTKREQVTKHEHTCEKQPNGRRTAESEEDPEPQSQKLPSIVTNPASAHGGYYTEADVMEL